MTDTTAAKAAAFFDMGGYAAFVWPSYAIVTLVMLGLLAWSLQNLTRAKQRLAELKQIDSVLAEDGDDS